MRCVALILITTAMVLAGCDTLQTGSGTSVVKVLPHYLDA
ncbi:uncharacterized protein METZ01_LOCUS374154, partial [marine metagenome]